VELPPSEAARDHPSEDLADRVSQRLLERIGWQEDRVGTAAEGEFRIEH
jgi:hypothetical protein